MYPGTSYFSKKNIRLFIASYGQLCVEVIHGINKGEHYEKASWDIDNFNISEKNLRRAIKEIRDDINIIYFRRKPKEISRGKIAGICCFRLTRWNPLTLTGENEIEDNLASKLNIICAHAFCKKFILNLKNIGITDTFESFTHGKIEASAINNEIVYTLKSRHVNQETLGIVYDVIFSYSKQNKI